MRNVYSKDCIGTDVSTETLFVNIEELCGRRPIVCNNRLLSKKTIAYIGLMDFYITYILSIYSMAI